MTKELTEKYNDSCVKLFEFLKMLYDGEVEFKKVIDHFSGGNYDGSSNTHVTINKYLNALKIFGIKVKKVKHKYHLLSPVYTLDFDKGDIKSIEILQEYAQLLPEGNNKRLFEEFIRALKIRFDESAQNILQTLNNSDTNFKFAYSEMAEQIQQCERYCQDKQKLEIVFSDEFGTELNLLCSPIEVTYVKRKICFRVLGNNGSRIYEIPLDNIKSIKQLPSASSQMSVPTTVVYRIKNKLAKYYKLRDWERLDSIEPDNSQIIVNKNEDLNLLIQRLMRYGTECEIISPKFIKEEMLNRINKTLDNYK